MVGLLDLNMLLLYYYYENALEIQWNTDEDFFVLASSPDRLPSTRQEALPIVASLFDPIGLVASFTLTGKLLLQSMCAEKCSLDFPLSQHILSKWKKWFVDLENLSNFRLPRCYKTYHKL